jgi:hypothetical protein
VRHLHHVTLTTGHVRRSLREEVSAAALAACQRMLGEVAGGLIASIPGTDLLLSGSSLSRCATLWVHDDDGINYLTIGLAAHSRCGARVWRRLHADAAAEAPIVTDADRCPPEPWVASRLERAAVLLSEDELMTLGDLGRCLGWAWVDRAAGSRPA